MLLLLPLTLCLLVLTLSPFISQIKKKKNLSEKSGKREYPCLIPDFRGETSSFSQLSTALVVGLSYVAFIILRYDPFVLILLRVAF